MSERLLLTGFGPFPGVTHNPTSAIVDRLNGRMVAGAMIFGGHLDVRYDEVGADFDTLWDAHKPSMVLMLGVARTAHHIRLESSAQNVMSATSPDNIGVYRDAQPIDLDHPTAHRLTTHLELSAVCLSLTTRGFSAVISSDAGRYVCNRLYYHALHKLMASGESTLFMHVPPLNTYPSQNVLDSPDWTEERLVAATETVIESLVQAASHHK